MGLIYAVATLTHFLSDILLMNSYLRLKLIFKVHLYSYFFLFYQKIYLQYNLLLPKITFILFILQQIIHYFNQFWFSYQNYNVLSQTGLHQFQATRINIRLRNQLSVNLKQSIEKLIIEDLCANETSLQKIKEIMAEKRAQINKSEKLTELLKIAEEEIDFETEQFEEFLEQEYPFLLDLNRGILTASFA